MSEQPSQTPPASDTRLVAGVRFRPAGRIYYYDARRFPNLKTGQYVIVETVRGKEAGRVVIAPKQVLASELGDDLKAVERLAEEDDLRKLLAFKKEERNALRLCQERVQQRQLAMKLVEAEYTLSLIHI